VFSLLDPKSPLVLASNSPRRSDLIKQLGLPFEVIGTSVDEEYRPYESPRDHVQRLALEKAESVAHLRPRQWIISADTIVLLNGEVLGKPRDQADARRMLKTLSGRKHRVMTAFCILNKSLGICSLRLVETDVTIKHLSSQEVDAYLSTGEPMDKAGAYGAQGIGSFLIREIRGSYTNVVGLPTCELAEELIRLGIIRIQSTASAQTERSATHG
jgi:septum formation protein